MMPLDAPSDDMFSQRLLVLYATMVVVLRSRFYSTISSLSIHNLTATQPQPQLHHVYLYNLRAGEAEP